MPLLPTTAARRSQSGFALLITITLLAFLVLLLVSLAALTRVETQISANSRQLSQARQNALMAMNIALGQVQLMLGPDQRITAPAGQKGDGTTAYAAADSDNNANWTGVYRQNPNPAVTTRDPQLLNWLVSGNQTLTVPASGANIPTVVPAAIVTGLTPAMTATTSVTVGGKSAVLLVGPGSTVAGPTASAPASVVDRFVVAPMEPIQVPANTLPGFDAASSASTTVGNFAYWVGDEGVKAKVSPVDPWESPATATLDATTPATTVAQARDYRFVNAQRLGIEGITFDAGGTKLSGYAATDDNFKANLPKVLALSQLSLANSDPADSSKFGLPKWELIRDYATTFTTPTAATPQRQTPTKQGISPVITYVRMAYNLTCAAVGTPPDLNIMPVVALWNPYNVKIAAKTYEFCVQYSNLNSATYPDNRLCLRTNGYLPHNAANPILAPETFDLSLIRVAHSANVNWNGNISAGTQEYGETTSTTQAEYFRFRLEVSKDLEPGESRLFTICDSGDSPDGYDGTLYKGGVSQMSDRGALRNDVGVNNAVRMRGQVPFGPTIVGQIQLLYLVPFPIPTPPLYTPIVNYARMEALLSDPLPASVPSGNPDAVRQFLRTNAYQRIVGAGFDWQPTMEVLKIPPVNTGEPLFYHRLELMMSDLPTSFPESNLQAHQDPGSPRWLATLNPQASVFLRKPFVEQSGVARSNFNPSYLVEYYVKPPNGGFGSLNLIKHDLPNADANGRVSAGTRVSNTSAGAQNLVIRELPSSSTPLFSIAQLQHANASLLNLNPAYAIGNSHANLYVNRDSSWTVLTKTDSFAADDATAAANPGAFPGGPTSGFPDLSTFSRIYDLSYLLNKTLWDGYFFSTIPTSLTRLQADNANYHLPNSRHDFYWTTGSPNDVDVAELKTVEGAASHLRVDGGFNVNSTSVEAWRALLYAHNGVSNDPDDPLNKNPLSRFATALSSPVSGSKPNDTWLGYRILSDAQIDVLAEKIVAEIRTRGPFLSLADFVNRRLVKDRTGLKGALQAAIDATTANQVSTTVALPANTYPRDIKDNTGKVAADPEQQIVYTGTLNAANTAPDTAQIAASRVSLAPGYLSQADLLTAIGPSLSARSDTYRIRAYGDVQNPATGLVEGRAWCEAIVQRCPEYINTADAPSVLPGALIAANKTFGRRFTVVSFRWLSADEI